MKYSEHKAKWKDCQLCPLGKTRTRIVLARGTVPCKVLFIGEAPGASEDSHGVPFIGPAGHLLDRIIKEALPPFTTFALTNLVACIPLGDDGNKTAEPSKESITACQDRLWEFVEMCQPELVVLVGTLSKKHFGTSDQWATTDIIHPAAILRMDVSQKGLAIQRSIVRISTALENAEVPF